MCGVDVYVASNMPVKQRAFAKYCSNRCRNEGNRIKTYNFTSFNKKKKTNDE